MTVISEAGRPRAQTTQKGRRRSAGSGTITMMIPAATMAATAGTTNADFAERLMTEAARTLPTLDNPEQAVGFLTEAMTAFAPADPIEAMLAAQAVALHSMTMRCAALAQVPEQPAEIAHQLRKSAIGASRGFAEVLAALDRKRGRGSQQAVRVEHVHVHEGGQAIVGNVGAGGGGGRSESAPEPFAGRLEAAAALGLGISPVRSQDAPGEALPAVRDAERPVSPARRRQHGAADG